MFGKVYWVICHSFLRVLLTLRSHISPKKISHIGFDSSREYEIDTGKNFNRKCKPRKSLCKWERMLYNGQILPWCLPADPLVPWGTNTWYPEMWYCLCLLADLCPCAGFCIDEDFPLAKWSSAICYIWIWGLEDRNEVDYSTRSVAGLQTKSSF